MTTKKKSTVPDSVVVSELFVLLARERFATLSDREKFVAVQRALGRSNAETCKVLDLNVKTVDTYLSRIREKLGIANCLEIPLMVIAAIGLEIEPCKHEQKVLMCECCHREIKENQSCV